MCVCGLTQFFNLLTGSECSECGGWYVSGDNTFTWITRGSDQTLHYQKICTPRKLVLDPVKNVTRKSSKSHLTKWNPSQVGLVSWILQIFHINFNFVYHHLKFNETGSCRHGWNLYFDGKNHDGECCTHIFFIRSTDI